MRLLALTGESDRPESALLCGLAQRGLAVHVVGMLSEDKQQQLKEAGCRFTQHNCRSRLHPATIRLIRNLFDQESYDILHAFTNRMLTNALIATCGKSVKRFAYRGTCGHISRWDPSAWLSYLNPGVHGISCVSSAVRDYLLSCNLPSERLAVIYKGHELAWYANLAAPSLTEFGIPADACVAGCTANMRPVKGVDVLIQAHALLPKELNLHLLLVGEVRDQRIQNLISSSPRREQIHAVGFRKDASALAGRCQIFVMPSIEREGLPKAVIEAMAQGVAPIVTNVGGMPELVRHEQDGLVVPPKDPLVLASALKRLALDLNLRENLAKQARQRIAQDFTVEKMIAGTLALYRS